MWDLTNKVDLHYLRDFANFMRVRNNFGKFTDVLCRGFSFWKLGWMD